MNVLTLGALLTFGARHPDAAVPLRAWYKQVRSREYTSFADVKADFNSADWVGSLIVFDIGGNKYRVIVRPNFQGKRFYIEAVLTHREYDDWRL